jgi:hypothetical protein
MKMRPHLEAKVHHDASKDDDARRCLESKVKERRASLEAFAVP